MKYELQNVISGKSKVIHGNAIQAVDFTLKEAREQVNWLKNQSSSESKKQKS